MSSRQRQLRSDDTHLDQVCQRFGRGQHSIAALERRGGGAVEDVVRQGRHRRGGEQAVVRRVPQGLLGQRLIVRVCFLSAKPYPVSRVMKIWYNPRTIVRLSR